MDTEFNKPLNIGNLGYYLDLNNKLEKEVGDFLHANTNAPHLYGNDIRHQYASALYARNFGNDKAKMLGDLGEKWDNFWGADRRDSQADLINNEIGRRYGVENPNMSKNDLLFLLLKDYNKNVEYRKSRG